MEKYFFPTTLKEMKEIGIGKLDIILISPEAYIDHPSSGIAIIAHLLKAHGYTVGIIDQPDWRNSEDFTRLGSPWLFFGITSGGLDSMLANYTATKKKRRDDRNFSEHSFSRPDRTVIVYCNKIREFFKEVPIVIGGIEASLRRLAHYDYWTDSVRRSIILDSRADILVYGMGERQILEIAERFRQGKGLENIRGTVIRLKKGNVLPPSTIILPGFNKISINKDEFNRSFLIQSAENSPFLGRPLLEEYENTAIIQYPPSLPLSEAEMDYLYSLPFSRMAHSKYNFPVKALEPVLFSVITHRGCFGGCSFCSLSFHQGKIIQSRSEESIIKEVEKLSQDLRFKGYIYDLGGPTANMFGLNCSGYLSGKDSIETSSIEDRTGISLKYNNKFKCRKNCLSCPNLSENYDKLTGLLKELRSLKKIKKVFIRSGVRYDLALMNEKYLFDLIKHHISGQLKVAPEHVSPEVLKLMNKPPVEVFNKFLKRFFEINHKVNKNQFLIPYFIVAHPGSGEAEAKSLANYIKNKGIAVEQIQIFIPTPMTLSTCMYYTGKDPYSKREIYIPKTIAEKEGQKNMLLKSGNKVKKRLF